MFMIVSLLVAAIVDGPPFALTTNGGSLDGHVNGQVAVPGGGQVKVPTPRVDQVLFKAVPPLALAWRMR
jgi:hypothetical protein